MIVKKLVVGSLENNCYIVADEKTKECFMTDPGDEPDRILDLLRENKYRLKYIICTHAHFDHVAAIPEMKGETKAQIILHRDDLDIYRSAKDQAAAWGYEIDPLPEPDLFVSDGDILEVGDLKFEVLHTPGHSPGGICLFGEGILITGDTLFAGSVGRTDLYGGDIKELKKSFNRLMLLPDDMKVLPGHGPESTVGKEKIDNFFSYEYNK
jgi:glyoxylase-like metal-dependent hydrolase (beta-lactamase superfamily II)